jgi:squalene-hopene/tetraprenyl-beta-curcumene cyclase
MNTRLGWFACCAGLIALGAVAVPSPATPGEDRLGPDPKELQQVLDRAVAFLKSQQAGDGSFSSKRAGPGISAVVAAALLRNGYSPSDPVVARTLDYLTKQVQPDGGIYDKALANYTTSVAIMAFREANKDGKYDVILSNAGKFLKGIQHDERTTKKDDPRYGGFSYDGKGKPDASNSTFSIEAMLAAGIPKDDPAIKKALEFISRCQNLPGEFNDQAFAKKASADDLGGLTYTPLDPDDSPHKTPDGGLRSLGGMTYGGLKSFLYAGVSKDDPRVKAAIGWCRAHYTLDENPGMGQRGLYYYYHTFAKAMDAWGEDRFADKSDKKHDWRRELFEALRKRQRPDGSWINADDKTFGEADPNLATAFAILSLSYCKVSKK